MPLFVRTGSILPLGPTKQWAGEKPDAPIEIRVYPGTDASFALYEDEGTNYNYEKGAYSVIPFRWNDRRGELTIERREGDFSGMRPERRFAVALVKSGANGETAVLKPVVYAGDAVTVHLH
jgi:alpha-D-xyloside xylohydrolase